MRFLFYIFLMTLFSPLLLVGLPFYMVPIMQTRGRVSGTTYEPFNGRLLYHLMGTRPDPAALQLAAGLPAMGPVAMLLMVKPLILASKISGYIPAMVQYPPPYPAPFSAMMGARCEFLDQAMLDKISAGDQVVILGAGWDTRAYGLLKGRGVTVFEVDAPATQAQKRAAVEKTDIDASAVNFVTCDFNRQSWLDALVATGLNVNVRTFILWEGVTMYLQEQAIQSTLRTVATLAPGSTIAFDFFSREWLQDTRAGRASARGAKFTYGEPLLFGFPVTPDFSTALDDYLGAQGLSLTASRPMGADAAGELPYGGLVLAMKSAGTSP
jgi:methyltransferase (TIGR00027 family)